MYIHIQSLKESTPQLKIAVISIALIMRLSKVYPLHCLRWLKFMIVCCRFYYKTCKVLFPTRDELHVFSVTLKIRRKGYFVYVG